DLVRRRLAKNGDDGTRPRSVVHACRPRDPDDEDARARVVAELKWVRGYAMGEDNSGIGLEFEHVTTLSPSEFDCVTKELSDFLAAMGWRYAGWRCGQIE